MLGRRSFHGNDSGHRLNMSRTLIVRGRHEALERHAREEAFDDAVEILPEVMREARGAALAGSFPAALRRIHVFVDRINDAFDRDFTRREGKAIAAPGTAGALDKAGAAQSNKKSARDT